MKHPDIEYLDFARNILENGTVKGDRTGTGTISIFGGQMKFDLSKGFPLLTTKRVPFRIVAEELLWFVKGDTNLKTLLDKNVSIWNDDAYRFYLEQGGTMGKEEFLDKVKEEGFDMGAIYGAQWTNWNNEGINQLENVIEEIKNNPNSRRHIVTAWNPSVLDKITLPACHTLYQFNVTDGKLSCMLFQRSNDIFLGNPFNIASYALLTYIVAKMTGLEVGELTIAIGDAHIYLNHVEQIKLQMTREPRDLPTLTVKTVHENIQDYTIEDFELTGYDPHPTIKGKVSVGLKKAGEEDS